MDLIGKPFYRPFSFEGDFFSLFERIERHYETCFLLESLSSESYDSRYSVIGFGPDYLVEGGKKSLRINSRIIECDNPYYELRRQFGHNVIARNYAGGLVGYLGYDAMNFFEPSLRLQEHPDFPAMLFGFYSDGLVHDTFTGETFYFHYKKSREAELHEIVSAPAPSAQSRQAARPQVRRLGYSRTRDQHRKMVLDAIEQIKAGNTFQCQIGFMAEYEIEGDTLPLYLRLREVNPSPHMFYLKFGKRKLLGASPELIFRLRQGEMESFPLAGTTRRGASDAEDRELVRELLNNPKEIAEHNMLIDLHRNDIGRVARFGTVKVRRQFDIKRFSHVQHISSEVVGIIRRDRDMYDGLASSFPAGTLSGAPKIESMKIIEQIENSPRGPYGGAVGHFGLNGDCTFCIPIRTLCISENRAFARAAGGVVYDSTPEGEYAEILQKLAAMEKTLADFAVDDSSEKGEQGGGAT